MNSYRCIHCKKVVKRDSTKYWVRSYCDQTGKTVHLALKRGKPSPDSTTAMATATGETT